MLREEAGGKKLICTDLDGTFIGDDRSMYDLLQTIEGKDLILVFDSGRHIRSIMGFVDEKGIRKPDACICLVGTEVFILENGEFVLDERWSDIISEDWDREKIADILRDIKELSIQDDEWQTKFKASYFLTENVQGVLQEIAGRLQRAGIRATIVYSADKFLDFLPINSGKAKATDYLAQKFDVAREDVVACGDSGNDLDLFESGFKGIIVGNSHDELKQYTGNNAYHAAGDYSAGIIEGLKHFRFL
jgi:sucrose-6F-phosphate phosphohydrolase